MYLYLIRHGDPDYGRDVLTDRGREQAAAVAERLSHSGITKVVSSPLGRATETASYTCRALGLPMEIEPWAYELTDEERFTPLPDGRRGSISLLPNTFFRRDGGEDLPYDRACECAPLVPTGMRGALSRVGEGGDEFLARQGYRAEGGVYRIVAPSDERIAFFGHIGLFKVWCSILLHIPLHMFWAGFDYTHTGVSVLEFRNEKDGICDPRCLSFSDMSHLYAGKLDMKCNNREEI